MVDPTKYKYMVIIMDEKKQQYDITNFINNVSWEECDGELASRVTFTSKNEKTIKGRISGLAKPGCWIGLVYNYNGGKLKECYRGKIVEWNPSAKASSQDFRVKSYDVLYDLQESNDHVYFSSGIKTKSAITQLLKKWGIPISTYNGPNVTHGKIVYKNEKNGTCIIKILKEAKRKGGKDAVLRAVKESVSVLSYGSNTTIYHFEETEHLTEVNHKISTVGMVTRVKVIGKENKKGSAPVEATVDGQTAYGIRQKIYTRGSDETLKEAKRAAKDIIEEDGVPKEDISITLPDMPDVRKGDQIHLKTSSIEAGFYYVIGVRHDIDSMSMTLELKKASEYKDADEEENAAEKTGSSKKNYKVGDIVSFKGGYHYVSSDGSKGYKVSAGKAKITIKNPGSDHPWHLVTQNWNKTQVYGWVDDGSFE